MAGELFVYLIAMVDMSYYHASDHGYLDLHITPYEPTSASVYLPWSDVMTYDLDVDTLHLTYRLTETQTELGLERPLRIESLKPLTVQVSMGKTGSTLQIAYLSLPLTSESTRYFLASYTNRLAAYSQLYAVAAYGDDADVSVYRHSGGGRHLVTTFTVEAGRLRQVVALDRDVDVTGFELTSTSPVAAFSGHQCANVPTSALYCDPIYQQLLPVHALGSAYALGPIAGRAPGAGYTIRIVKTTADTDITLQRPADVDDDDDDDAVSITYHGAGNCSALWQRPSIGAIRKASCSGDPDVGDFVEARIRTASAGGGGVVVRCSAPCLVIQYNHGSSVDGRHSDPFMMLILPARLDGATVRFSTFQLMSQGSRLEHDSYATIATSCPEEGFRLDGEPTDGAVWRRVAEFRTTSLGLPPGEHEISNEDGCQSFHVQLYGHGPESGFSGRSGSGMPLGGVQRSYGSTLASNAASSTVNPGSMSTWRTTQKREQTTSDVPSLYTTSDHRSRKLFIGSRTSPTTARTERTTRYSTRHRSGSTRGKTLPRTDRTTRISSPPSIPATKLSNPATTDPVDFTVWLSGSTITKDLFVAIVIIIVLGVSLLHTIITLIVVIVRRKKKTYRPAVPAVYYSSGQRSAVNPYLDMPVQGSRLAKDDCTVGNKPGLGHGYSQPAVLHDTVPFTTKVDEYEAI